MEPPRRYHYMHLIPPSFCRFDHLCAVHHQKVLHPQKETPMFFAQGRRRGKHRYKRDVIVSMDEGCWREPCAYLGSRWYGTTALNHSGQSRSVNVVVLEGLVTEAVHAHQA